MKTSLKTTAIVLVCRPRRLWLFAQVIMGFFAALGTTPAHVNSPVGACPQVGTGWDTNFYPSTMTAAGMGWVRIEFRLGTNTLWTSNALAAYDPFVDAALELDEQPGGRPILVPCSFSVQIAAPEHGGRRVATHQGSQANPTLAGATCLLQKTPRAENRDIQTIFRNL